MSREIVKSQKAVLSSLSGKIDDFYLAGGTALSLFYFQHRDSLDLDFFTKKFSRARILDTINFLSNSLKTKINLVSQQSGKGKVKVMVFTAQLKGQEVLKIDFVQDYFGLIKPLKTVNGINIMSLEDIYFRKIFAAVETVPSLDEIGRRIRLGGRQEAKDFYDLFYLSNTLMRLSDFSFKYCDRLTREGIIRWFRTYNRMDMKTGLLELKLKNRPDYRAMELHFKREIDRILEKEIGQI
jgi:predicted nucleotidyltransferase component of viral defense system